MAVVSGASIIAVTATVGTFKGASDIGGYTSLLIPLSAICFLGAAVYSLISLFRASSRLVRFSWGTVPAREEAERSLTSSYSWPRRITYFLFSFGLIFLVFYVYSGEVLSRILRMI
jgi:hypothetical protein